MRLPLPDTLDVITFRAARAADSDGLISLFQCFFADSNLPSFGLHFDPARMRAWVDKALATGSPAHIVAVDAETGKVVGSIAYHLTQSFTDKPVAEMGRFYVLRAWRRSAIGHVLLTLAMEGAKAEGAAAFMVLLNSGNPGSQNIFRRFGFRETPHAKVFGKEL